MKICEIEFCSMFYSNYFARGYLYEINLPCDPVTDVNKVITKQTNILLYTGNLHIFSDPGIVKKNVYNLFHFWTLPKTKCTSKSADGFDRYKINNR